jgi:hypothetical protein
VYPYPIHTRYGIRRVSDVSAYLRGVVCTAQGSDTINTQQPNSPNHKTLPLPNQNIIMPPPNYLHDHPKDNFPYITKSTIPHFQDHSNHNNHTIHQHNTILHPNHSYHNTWSMFEHHSDPTSFPKPITHTLNTAKTYTPPTQPRPLDIVSIDWLPLIAQQKCSGPYNMVQIAAYVESAISNIVFLCIASSSKLISTPKDIWASGTNYANYRELGAPITWQIGLLIEISKMGNSQVEGRIGNREWIPL